MPNNQQTRRGRRPEAGSNRNQIYSRIPDEMMAEIQRLAVGTSQTVSEVVRDLLAVALKEK